jgi:hypothetical protein
MRTNCTVVARDVDKISVPTAKAFGIEEVGVEDFFGMQRSLQSVGGLSTDVRKSR